MASHSVLIRVPATIGNFGGAKDAAALALDASLNVKVTPRLDGQVNIRYFGENGERVPRDRSNLVVRAMESALHLRELEFTGADFEIYSSVPVSVGLGSSTAAVLAGLLAADRLYDLKLDEKTIFELAAIYESRGDNLRAALAEMARVTGRGGTIGAYVWDYADKMELMRFFWDAAVELDPDAAKMDEGTRFPLCRPEPLVELFASATWML